MSRLLIRHGAVQRGRTVVLQPGRIATELPAAIGVVGVNGSGKTSLFMHLADVLHRRLPRPEVSVGNAEVRIALAPQAPALPGWLRAREAAALYGLQFDQLLADMPALHLDEIATKTIGSMSLGQQQALAVALSLGVDASLLILDEPFSALDFRRRVALLQLLAEWKMKRSDRALLLSSQNAADLLELCDHFVVLRNGRYVFNGPRSELVPAGAGDARRAEQRLLELLT